MELLNQTAAEESVDMIIVSEPNKRVVGREDWYTDRGVDVVIKTYGMKATIGREGSGNGYVWVNILDLVMVGVYFSPNKDLNDFEIFLESLKTVLQLHRGKKIVMGGGTLMLRVPSGTHLLRTKEG